MDSMAIEMRREYLRNWRAANKEKVKRYNATYWEKKAQERKKEQNLGKVDQYGETVPEERIPG